jgi:hypothetical protein
MEPKETVPQQVYFIDHLVETEKNAWSFGDRYRQIRRQNVCAHGLKLAVIYGKGSEKYVEELAQKNSYHVGMQN